MNCGAALEAGMDRLAHRQQAPHRVPPVPRGRGAV
jgi:hypothetical protein